VSLHCLDLPKTATGAAFQAEPPVCRYAVDSGRPRIPEHHASKGLVRGVVARELPLWAELFPTECSRPRIVDSLGIESFSNPLTSYQRDQAQQQLRIKQARAGTIARLNELKLEAIRTDNLVSRSSLQDLHDALRSLAFTRRPAIFLLENGNFRVMWKNAAPEQVAIQFLGDKKAQFVIFASITTRLAGITAIDRLDALITASKAANLLS
jgi:hypothetical protein